MIQKVKIKGFNDKEQKIFNHIAKTPGESCQISELAKLFIKEAELVTGKAQSYVRNSLRRLIRDGWVHKTSYGAYSLTTEGKQWVKEGKNETASFGDKSGRRPKAEVAKKSSKKKIAKKATVATNNKSTVKMRAGASASKPVKTPPSLRRAMNRKARKEIGPATARQRAQELAIEIAKEEDQASSGPPISC